MSTSDAASNLAVEIRRIVSLPYAVSLRVCPSLVRELSVYRLTLPKQNLDSILNSLPLRDLTTWALSHPCQTHALADAVLTGLEICPYALGVLEVVAKVKEIRDEMLQIKPALLDGFLRNAMADENNFDKVRWPGGNLSLRYEKGN